MMTQGMQPIANPMKYIGHPRALSGNLKNKTDRMVANPRYHKDANI